MLECNVFFAMSKKVWMKNKTWCSKKLHTLSGTEGIVNLHNYNDGKRNADDSSVPGLSTHAGFALKFGPFKFEKI